MIRPRIVAGLAAMGAVAAMNLVAACTPSDDNDVFTTPTPPEPTPVSTTICQIVWTNQNGPLLDIFVVEAGQGAWLNGAQEDAFDPEDPYAGFTRWYQEEAELDANYYAARPEQPTAIVRTGGDFDVVLTLGGTAPGSDAGYIDVTNDVLTGWDTAGNVIVLGSAGEGTFSGVWSASGSPDFEMGHTVEVVIGSASTLVGNFGSFAACHEIQE